ncbi:MAG: MBOAT family O-acyltransferase [bacterium]|nr:MBOAT family O-acyltransferase [bacterium]
MLFNSVAFAFFMPIVFFIYWALPHRYRWMALLAANCWFYMSWEPKYIIVILLTTVVSYFGAIGIEGAKNTSRKKWILVLGTLVTLSFLLVFKYTDFALSSVWKVLQLFAVPVQKTTLNLVMPIGISFYTFQMVGYLADVYTGKLKAERHFGHYALFVTFFPNILSGPIERAANMLPQFKKEKKFHYDDAAYGMRLILLGFLKKLIFADSMSRYVDNVFNHTEGASGLAFVIAIILFTFQIYCDFSGYSDIAIGVARLLGIRLMDNFKQPYYAASVREFWQRWHISLSTWFRDYVYIPLGGNRVSKARKNLNLLLTFLTSGLWHGANWTFVLWGGIHGLYQIIENTIKSAWKKRKKTTSETSAASQGHSKLVHIAQTILTFCLVAYAWMFFRANSITDAIYITTHLFQGYDITQALLDAGMTHLSIIKTLLAIIVLMVYDYFSLKHDLLIKIEKLKLPFRWLIYIIVTVLIIVLSLHNGVKQEFIYFKF